MINWQCEHAIIQAFFECKMFQILDVFAYFRCQIWILTHSIKMLSWKKAFVNSIAVFWVLQKCKFWCLNAFVGCLNRFIESIWMSVCVFCVHVRVGVYVSVCVCVFVVCTCPTKNGQGAHPLLPPSSGGNLWFLIMRHIILNNICLIKINSCKNYLNQWYSIIFV